MPQAVDNLASVLQELSDQLHNLERRVAALESQTSPVILSVAGAARSEASAETKDPYPTNDQTRQPATWGGFPPVELPNAAVPVLGKAVLAIAGAYLLRAIAESPSIPKFPVLIVAILYAGFWIAWAARTHTANRFASAAYAITSALILSPLLWESTVRFQVLSATFTAVVLAAYVMVAIALAWRGDLQLIPWVATLASITTALALIIATHELVPLTIALLIVALATEAAACLGHLLSLRAIPALAADLAIVVLVSILASSDAVPEGYRPAAPVTITLLCFLLLAIYAGSIGIRTFALRHRITIFEIAQAALAFALASFGVMRATHDAIGHALGISLLVLAAVCYWGALVSFARDADTRNRRCCATWAAALLVAGSFLLFSTSFQIRFLCLAATACAITYFRTRKFSLGLHASSYLAAAAAVSPLPVYAANALAGTVPGMPDSRVLFVLATAAVCYVIGSRVSEAQSRCHLIWTIPAAVVGFAAAAITVVASAPLLASVAKSGDFASTLSVIRTVVNCVLALALAYLGSRRNRIELRWVAYAAVAFGTLKLVFEDLRFGNAATLVVSFLFYGLVLILLPRLTRHAQSQSP